MSRFKRVLSFILTMVMLVGIMPQLGIAVDAANITYTFLPNSGTFTKTNSTANVTVDVDSSIYLGQELYKTHWEEISISRNKYVFNGWQWQGDTSFKLEDSGGTIYYHRGDPGTGSKRNFKATWASTSYKILFDPAGGEMTYGSEEYWALKGYPYWKILIKDCRPGTIPKAVKAGYDFDGWVHEATGWILADHEYKIPDDGFIFATEDEHTLSVRQKYNYTNNQTFTAHWVCNHDEDFWGRREEITDSTCSTAGRHDYYCGNEECGEWVRSETIPQKEHVLVEHESKTPTCTEHGWDSYQTCSNCDYTTYVEIPATGHATNDETHPWIDQNDGTSIRYCSNGCGEVFDRNNPYEIKYFDFDGEYSGDNNKDEDTTNDLPGGYIFSEGATLPDGIKRGHDFDGWYSNPECTGDKTSSVSTSTW